MHPAKPEKNRWRVTRGGGGSRGPSSLAKSWNFHAVQFGHIRAQQLRASFFRQVSEVPFNVFERIRPGRVLMREVVRPHTVVHSPPFQAAAADSVFEKRGVNL